jgi:hypothetical protein
MRYDHVLALIFHRLGAKMGDFYVYLQTYLV